MILLTASEIDRILEEDIPLVDLTTEVLGLSGEGKITFISREKGILCGTEEVESIFERLKIKTEYSLKSGDKIDKNQEIIIGYGDVKALHKAWKISLNILEYMSGIATAANKFVELAKSVNPYVTVVTTRKFMPMTKKFVLKAIMTGGASPHRISLSDTVLIFKQHLEFISFEDVLKKSKEIKKKLGNKQIGIEVDTKEEAKRAIDSGFDFIQLDKWSIEDIEEIVNYRNVNNPNTLIAVAGGINYNNVVEYAKTGIDIIVTTSLYWSKPLDMTAKIEKV
ncbi:MAG: ModD protein [Hydrogenothermaceae bacterium]